MVLALNNDRDFLGWISPWLSLVVIECSMCEGDHRRVVDSHRRRYCLDDGYGVVDDSIRVRVRGSEWSVCDYRMSYHLVSDDGLFMGDEHRSRVSESKPAVGIRSADYSS